MIGYVLDHLALTAGLAGRGTEHQQREMSRLLISAMDGGPPLTLPAVCLAVTAEERPGVANHVAALVADAPDGAIEVSGLARTRQLDALREEFPGSTGHRPMRCSKRSSATFPS